MAHDPRPAPLNDANLLSRLRDWRAARESEMHADLFDEAVELPDPRALDLVLRVGELLLASGESTEVVSESMLSLSVAFELPRAEVSVTFTAITLSTHPGGDQPPITGERVVRRRTLDYFRVNELHTWCRTRRWARWNWRAPSPGCGPSSAPARPTPTG